MNDRVTKESQNQSQYDSYCEKGGYEMGPWSTHIMRSDPRHIGFIFARYKFVAKMLAGKKDVLEIGCGDALGSAVVLQEVLSLHGIDFEPLILEDARKRYKKEGIKNCSFEVLNITECSTDKIFDAAFSLDVLEHVDSRNEDAFFANICGSLHKNGVFIVGTPNLSAQAYASKASAEGHINLKDATALRSLMSKYFNNVFIFSMNDEVVHTGYYPMAHYLLGMGVGKK